VKAALTINAAHSALEDAEIALDRVRVHIASDVFTIRMSDGFVGRELGTDFHVEAAFIGVQAALAVNVLTHDAGDRVAISYWG
jgi:hypothetical protein